MSDQRVLEIHMLRDFAVVFDGRTVALGKNTGAKFLSFLQMLILAGDQGASREEIIDSLFAGEDLANITNSLNNLVYQSRRQLQRSALPEDTGIRKEKNRYFFSSSLPVVTDVRLFNEAARDAHDEDGLKAAFSLYHGDLLPSVTGNAGITELRNALRKDYKAVVAGLSAILIKKRDPAGLTALYNEAMQTTISEDGDLEAGLISALLDAGDAHAALKHYNKALRRYQSQGIGSIPDRLEACAPRLLAVGAAEQGSSLKTQLLDVMATANEKTAEWDGAFYCNYPSFIDAVKLQRRNLPRDPRPVTLMLLTLVDYEGKPLRMERKQILYSGELQDAIRGALRIGDSFTRHDETGFLILLPGADEENAVAIYSRIARKLKEKAGSNAAVRYRMLSLNSLDQDQL
ncbi:MAG: hypothetical protein K6G16_05645 [Lachnospiraceae bacterium]|nr:hypothetical protein [Lachnospiraceae bacterium]